jgi:hypothetical protein
MSDRPAHSWEDRRPKRHRWEEGPGELRDEGGFWGEFSDSDSDPGTTPGQELVDKLLSLHLCNKISASDCCTSMWWAKESGVQEALPYALPPTSSSGHCSRKLRNAMGHNDSDSLYKFNVAGHSKHDLSRSLREYSCMPLHEQVALDVAEDVGCRTKLSELYRQRAFPPVYWDHPVVKKCDGTPVLPIAIYIDAVPFSLTDSVLGFWGVNLVTHKRYLWGLLCKSQACRCGCRGWCSFHTFFSIAAWSLEALATATWPQSRHDGSAFLVDDQMRADRSGDQVRLHCCCLYVKGDWSEYNATLGFPSWQDGCRPCFLCNGTGNAMYIATGNSDDALRWDENSDTAYDEACQRCCITVHIPDEATRAAIVFRLRYDKRPSGSHGRVLIEDMPALGLLQHDRLEPSSSCVDVGGVADLKVPGTVVFWRTSEETLARHNNPMLKASLGLSPTVGLTVDILHAVHLGVLKVWCRIVVWTILASGIYGQIGTADETLQIALLAFRAALMSFYKRHHAEHPFDNLTRVADFTMKMIGTRTAPKLKTKGAETFGLMKFLLVLLRLHKATLGSDWIRLLQAGEALDTMIGIWTKHAGCWNIPPLDRKVKAMKGCLKTCCRQSPGDAPSCPRMHRCVRYSSAFYYTQ